MSMTDFSFLFLFLPAALLVSFLPGRRLRQAALLAASYLFYAAGSVMHLVLLVAMSALDLLLGVVITGPGKRRKRVACAALAAGVAAHVALLALYKYFGGMSTVRTLFSGQLQIASGAALPMGLSFFTFKGISYLADCKRGKIARTDPLQCFLYLSLFAQVQSGPLSRYDSLTECARGKARAELFGKGAYRFLCGFARKILLSNVLAQLTDEVFTAQQADVSTAFCWLGAICYSLQLYHDFAGYSDMAIGVTGMLGYSCPENFDFPYMTASVAEFWRRWHMTLGAWFRDYVYFPMGGSRVKSRARLYFNLLTVWFLTGIWHGSTLAFVFWGLTYFLAIALEKTLDLPNRLKSKWARRLYRLPVLLFINFEWVIFRAGHLKTGLRFIRNMLYCPVNGLANSRALFLLRDNAVFIAAALLLCFPVIPALEKACEGRKGAQTAFHMVQMIVLLGAFVWSLSFLAAGQNNPFAYANF